MSQQPGMSGATEILLIRHPETQANVPGEGARMAGGLTDSTLTVSGRRQVALLCHRLREAPPARAICSSPLPRAAHLAGDLARELGISVSLRPGLREIDCGRLDGVTIAEARREYPDIWEANLRQEDPDFRWPGGESYREFRQRCLDEMQAISDAHGGGPVLVITHAGVISQVVGHIHGISPARWKPFRPGNTSLTEIQWTARGAALVCFDDRGHLGPQAADMRAAG